MNYNIKPYKQAGKIEFGMHSSEVRKILACKFSSFLRTPFAKIPCDFFEELGLFIYYKQGGLVEAIEFTLPANPIFDGTNLLNLSFLEAMGILNQNEHEIEFENESFINHDLGIGVFGLNQYECKDFDIESIIVFEDGYYD